jgi:uncharacterized protein (TIGR00290 family)
MSDMEPVVLSWSGGKDSAMALYELRRSGAYDVVALLTTVAREFERVSHHGVRVELLEEQAAAVGVCLHKLYLPPNRCTNADYEALMERTMLNYRADGIRKVAFGDIFLADLRAYRERNLATVGMRGLFPIWHRNTRELMRTFISLGFRAHLACVDGTKLDRTFAGRPIDSILLGDLPPEVDPCGENGEFHSFVHDGPVFRRPVRVAVGDIVARDSRYFADLVPAGSPGRANVLGG